MNRYNVIGRYDRRSGARSLITLAEEPFARVLTRAELISQVTVTDVITIIHSIGYYYDELDYDINLLNTIDITKLISFLNPNNIYDIYTYL